MARSHSRSWTQEPVWRALLDFRQRFAAGDQPRVSDYLELAVGSQQQALEVMLGLMFAARPSDPQQLGLLWKDSYPMYAGVISMLVRAHTKILMLEGDDGEPLWHYSSSSRFVALEHIGSGAFGDVFRAFDWELRRFVAIKVLRSSSVNEAAVSVFDREAAAIARLRHPAIVGVHDVLRDSRGNPRAIVMEFLGGVSLNSLLRSVGPLAPERAARIAAVIADGLAEAHMADVIHRDLKPANIVVQDDDTPCVIDYGLALLGGFDASRAQVGTPGFLAPEQLADAAAVGCAADVWSLGVVLYAMLSGGRLPFEGMDYRARVLGGDAPKKLSAANPTVPAALEQVCMRCLRHEPAERPSAATVAHRLRTWLDYGDPTPRVAAYVRQSIKNTATLRLPTGDREPIQGFRFSPLIRDEAESGKSERGNPIVSIEHIARVERSFQIIGPSGIGKSAALRWIERWHARRWRDAWRRGASGADDLAVPVYLDLAAVTGDLTEAVSRRLLVRGVRCDYGIIAKWMRAGQIVLILDGAENYPGGCEKLAKQLDELRDDCGEDVRVVLSSRAGGIQAASDLPRYRMEQLGDTQILSILHRKLGREAASSLFAELAQRGLLGGFRLPVMSWFLALAHVRPNTTIDTNPGKLYATVLEERFREHSDGVILTTDLQAIAIAMVQHRTFSLSENLDWFRTQNPIIGKPFEIDKTQLERLITTGLVLIRKGQVQFAHDSLRDHFFAAAVVRHVDPRAACRLTAAIPAPAVWEHYVGLASEAEAQVFLDALQNRVRNALRLSYFWPWASGDGLLTLLRCLGSAPLHFESIRNSLLKVVQNYGRGILASFSPLPRYSDVPTNTQRLARWFRKNVTSAMLDDELSTKVMSFTDGRIWPGEFHHDRAWHDLVALIASFRTTEAGKFVESECREQKNWRPLSFLCAASPIEEAVSRIARALESPDTTGGGRLGLAALLVCLPPSAVVPVLESMLLHRMDRKVLEAIVSSIAQHEYDLFREDAALQRIWSPLDRSANIAIWSRFFCKAATCSNPKLHDAAIKALTGLNNRYLPVQAWRRFVRQLRSPNKTKAQFSVRPLAYAPKEKRWPTIHALSQLVARTDALEVAIEASRVLKRLDFEAFTGSLCHSTERFFSERAQSALCRLAVQISAREEMRTSPHEVRSIVLLLVGLNSNSDGLAQLCGSALGQFPYEEVVAALAARYEALGPETSDELRAECLVSLMEIGESMRSQTVFARWLYSGLGDESPAVRAAALRRAWPPGRDWYRLLEKEQGMQLLHQCSSDSDPDVSEIARDIMRRIQTAAHNAETLH